MYVLATEFFFCMSTFKARIHAIFHVQRLFDCQLAVPIGITIFHDAVNTSEYVEGYLLIPCEG